MWARWLRMIPDLNGMTPAGTERDGFSPLSPNFWRMSTSASKGRMTLEVEVTHQYNINMKRFFLIPEFKSKFYDSF